MNTPSPEQIEQARKWRDDSEFDIGYGFPPKEGAQEVDHMLAAYAAHVQAQAAPPAQPLQYRWSKDGSYRELYERVTAGGEAIGHIWPTGRDGDRLPAEIACVQSRWMEIRYADEFRMIDAFCSDEGPEPFIAECTRLKLQWISVVAEGEQEPVAWMRDDAVQP